MSDEKTVTDEMLNEVEPHGEPAASEPTANEIDWKAEARKWEKRAKENSGAAEELAKIRESQKSELEKATERAERAETELQEIKRAREREQEIAKASRETGVPIEVLSGYAGDDVGAYAANIKQYFEKHESTPRVGSDGAHGDTAVTRESILAIADPAKRKAAIAQHIELFERK